MQKERCDSKRESQSYVEADIFLYYVSLKYKTSWSPWFPETYPYFERSSKLKSISKMKSKKHMNKILSIFYSSEKQFIEIMNKQPHETGYEKIFKIIPLIRKNISEDELGIKL